MHENEYQLADRFTGHPFPRSEPESAPLAPNYQGGIMNHLPNAQESFIDELSTSLTHNQNERLYRMLAAATVDTIRAREFLMDSGAPWEPEMALSKVTNDLFEIRADLTSAAFPRWPHAVNLGAV